MSAYKVLLRAQRVLLRSSRDGLVEGGLYRWITVEASSEDEAFATAVKEVLSGEFYMEEVRNPPDDPPDFSADEIHLLDGNTDEIAYASGYTFYCEEP